MKRTTARNALDFPVNIGCVRINRSLGFVELEPLDRRP
jgi:hypothetical protein